MDYRDRNSNAPLVSGLTIILVAISAFILGFALSRTGIFSTWFGTTISDVLVNRGNGGIADFDHFWEVWDTIQEDYIDESLSNDALMQNAIKGMAYGLEDVGTVYFTPDEYRQYQSDSSGDFEGVGVYLESVNGNITVSSVIKGAPAEGAGLVSGDIITAVDSESLAGKTTDEAAALIKGPGGTDVILTVFSTGQTASRDVTITRAAVHEDAITWEEKELGIVYINIARFTEATPEDWNAEWDRVISEVSAKSPKVILIDLRFNGGGYLVSGVHAAEEFLPVGAFVTAQESPRINQKETYSVERQGRFVSADTDVIILVGRYTASASEIFVGALQKNDRATVIGEKTFGKGTAQSVYEFTDGSALKLTVSHWLMPDQTVLSKDNPITPDIEVPYNEEHTASHIDDIMNRALEEASRLLD